MDSLDIADWFGLISFLIAILSFNFNYIQYRKEKRLEKEVKTRMFAGMNAGYQALWRIAQIGDHIRNLKKNNQD